MSQLQSERLRNLTNGNTLLKISLGLIFFTILSSAFVYAQTISVDVAGSNYDVDYSVTGMSVSGIESDSDFISLILAVDVTDSPGILDVTFDRTFFDSVYGGADDEFIILADGDEAKFTETDTSSQSRTLRIELPSGTEEVEIIGSVFGRTIEEIPSETEETFEEKIPEKEIPAAFVDISKDKKFYVERYVTESSYKNWFEDNYSDYTFYEALDISKSELDKLIAEIEKENSEPTPVENSEPTPVENSEPTPVENSESTKTTECGPGTILQDRMCIAEPQVSASTTSAKGLGKDLGYGLIAAFVVTGIIAIILALMSKASKRRD